MKILVDGEIKYLTAITNNDVEWTENLLRISGSLHFDEDKDMYTMSADDFEWWSDIVDKLNKIEDMERELTNEEFETYCSECGGECDLETTVNAQLEWLSGKMEADKCADLIRNCSDCEEYSAHFDAKAAVQEVLNEMLNEFSEETVARVIAHQVIPSQDYMDDPNLDNPDFFDGRYSKKVTEWAKGVIANEKRHDFKNFDYCSINAHPVIINSLAEKFVDRQRELAAEADKKPSVLGSIEKIKAEQKAKQNERNPQTAPKKQKGQEL